MSIRISPLTYKLVYEEGSQEMLWREVNRTLLEKAKQRDEERARWMVSDAVKS